MTNQCVKHIAKTSNSKANNGVDNDIEYYRRPEIKAKIKARMKAYQQRPEVKAYRKEYYRRPEVIARRKAYGQRPEAIAYRKEYYRRPEAKAKAKTYSKAYWQRPEVIANYQRPEVKAKAKAYQQRPEVIARLKARYEKLKKLRPDPYFKRTPFYKQYGMTITEMGRRVGVSKEAIRRRYKSGIDVTTIGKQKSWSFTYASNNDSAKRISIRSR
tara:strand:+ start:4761 stop:5402 length:642 start_codon:yes stop_codon:yes gene_type:complete